MSCPAKTRHCPSWRWPTACGSAHRTSRSATRTVRPARSYGVADEVLTVLPGGRVRNASLYDPARRVLFLGPNGIPEFVDCHGSEFELYKRSEDDGYIPLVPRPPTSPPESRWPMARERTGRTKPATTRPQTAAPPSGEKENGNKPAYEVRLGRVKADVWANHGDAGVWFSVVFSRLYKEGDNWKRSESFSRDDLPLVAKLADRVHTWIFEQAGAANGMTQ